MDNNDASIANKQRITYTHMIETHGIPRYNDGLRSHTKNELRPMPTGTYWHSHRKGGALFKPTAKTKFGDHQLCSLTLVRKKAVS